LRNQRVLRNSRNGRTMGNTMTTTTPFLEQLNTLLPPRWKAEVTRTDLRSQDARTDALVEVTGPDGSSGVFLVELKPRVSPREAARIAEALSQLTRGEAGPTGILFTRYAGRLAQQRLREAGVSYLDLTGNAWIRLDRPAVFIEREGADVDPDPPRRGVQSLKGAKAARIARSLSDWRPPVGVRELARRTDTNAGYVTRVLSLLENEDVIVRAPTGEVADVRWRDLLLRWSEDYSVTGTNRAATFLAPRGLAQLQDRLARFEDAYAITGSFAVPPEAQVAPGRLFSCYVSSIETAADRLDVRPAEAGANVLLLEPFDRLPFERTRSRGRLTAVAMSQCVVDLLTGTGREPAQADALMTWMAENEDAWRS
jgi:hypothetical protein